MGQDWMVNTPEPDINIAISTAPAAQKQQGDQQNYVINK